MLVRRATISSRFRPSVSALSYVTSYPLSVFVRGTLPVPLSRQLLFRHHNRVSASLPVPHLFGSIQAFDAQRFISHVRFARSVSSVRTRRSVLWYS